MTRPLVRGSPSGAGVPSIRAVRGCDRAAVLAEALAARAAGSVALVGDERWSEELFAAQVAQAEQALADLAARDAETAARIGWAAFTSGSTGRPRVVLRTDESWQAGHGAVAGWLGLSAGEGLLVPVHPVSSMAVNAAAFCAATGTRLLVPGRARLRAEDLRGAAALHATPAQLLDVLDLLDDGADSTLRVLLIGGDRLPDGVRERAAAHGLRLSHYYGSAEASFVAVDHDGTGLRPLPGVEVRVGHDDAPAGVDGEGAVDEAVGPLEVRSPQLAAPDDSRLSDGVARWSEDGFLRTGDRAAWDPASGVLRVLGRADDAILTGGATVHPADVEAELQAVTGADGRPVAAAVLVLGIEDRRLGQRVAAWVQPVPGVGADEALAALRAAAPRRLSPAARPRRWQTVETLERTSSGKVRRVRPDGEVRSARPDGGEDGA